MITEMNGVWCFVGIMIGLTIAVCIAFILKLKNRIEQK